MEKGVHHNIGSFASTTLVLSKTSFIGQVVEAEQAVDEVAENAESLEVGFGVAHGSQQSKVACFICLALAVAFMNTMFVDPLFGDGSSRLIMRVDI